MPRNAKQKKVRANKRRGISIPLTAACGGRICVYPSKKNSGAEGWRAVLTRANKGKERSYGTTMATMTETVTALIEKFSSLIGADDRSQVLHTVMQHEARNLQGEGSQPIVSSTGRLVRYIHQIYGLFRDGKPMPPLFETSKKRWQKTAADMGAIHIMWSADEVDTLVREHYPQIWDTYIRVRYPIMRADMGRVAILHRYGGLYADLDVIPNRSEYKETRLTVCIQPSHIKKRKHFFEMEVLVAVQANALLLQWLEYMKQRIAKTPFERPGCFYHNARMRYVYNTTGPAAMGRFLRLTANQTEFKQLQYLHINRPEKATVMTFHDKQAYDVISFQSMSYETKALSQPTRVSEDSVDLPRVPIISKTRLRKKRRLPDGDTPHEQAEPIATAPQTADQCLSALAHEDTAIELHLARAELNRVNCMLAEERAHSRELIKRLFSEENGDRWSLVLGNLPPDMRAWVIPDNHVPRYDDTYELNPPYEINTDYAPSDVTLD